MTIHSTERPEELKLGESPDSIPGIHLNTPVEARALFERKVQEVLGITGKEFLARWDAGEYRPVPDTTEGRKIGRLVMILPFADRSIS